MTVHDAQPVAAADQLSAPALKALFDGASAYTVGIEDEVMLLHPDSFELTPRGQQLLGLLDQDPRFKLELPASQIEIVTAPHRHVPTIGAELLQARRALAERAEGLARLGSAGVHPFSAGVGELNRHARYRETIEEHAGVASRQLVCALQVHVSLGEAERALAVYNAARSYLPCLAALAANAPFYEGLDTGLASVRPKLSELLPRQGVPPAFASWEDYAAALRWGAAAGAFASPRTWWWELRLHPGHGTLEFRVPDGQSTVADAMAIAALTQSLVAWLGARHDAGEMLDVASRWRIEQNRWSACRHGVGGTMADLRTGESRLTRDCLHELLDDLAPTAAGFGSAEALTRARELVEFNGALAQREVAAGDGVHAVARWLAERFIRSTAG